GTDGSVPSMSIKRRALGRGLAALIPGAGAPAAPGGQTSNGSATKGADEGVAGTALANAAATANGLSPAAAAATRSAAGSPGPSEPRTEARAEAKAEGREGLRVVGIEEVHPARAQPRKSFNDARLDELAASIRSQGLIQPLVVRIRESGGYEIIAGERRWRAAQRAGLHTIPVVVREIAHARAFELAMVENLQREDLNPIEEAEGFDRLIREFGYSQESLAARVGKDRTTITNALRLLKLPPGVRGLVIAGRLSMGHARAILGLEALAQTGGTAAGTGPALAAASPAEIAERMEKLGRKVAAREMSVRQAEALVRSEKDGAASGSGSTAATPAESGPGTVSGRDLSTRLSRSLGTRVRVVERGPGSGHLEIHYGSLDQLDGLLAKLLP
ncbi:MAG: ParB/RepB/Spo0J family partition protein, partial [Myxococcales bacterium]